MELLIFLLALSIPHSLQGDPLKFSIEKNSLTGTRILKLEPVNKSTDSEEGQISTEPPTEVTTEATTEETTEATTESTTEAQTTTIFKTTEPTTNVATTEASVTSTSETLTGATTTLKIETTPSSGGISKFSNSVEISFMLTFLHFILL
jgi:hypothetical protein